MVTSFATGGWAELRGQGITVMLNTYERPDMLRSAVEHYSQCGAVSSIRVIWCEKGSPPNIKSWALAPRNKLRGALKTDKIE